MPFKFQFNKTALQQIKKQLEIRVNALPTLKNKETALRMEVKKAMKEKQNTLHTISTLDKENEPLIQFWEEFQIAIPIRDVFIKKRNIAGIKVPALEKIAFEEVEMSLFVLPAWVLSGMEYIKQRTYLEFSLKLADIQINILTLARKKTTQKVNLYEKVQIPAFQEATIRIKRFLEDKENISKAAQKMIKNRKQLEEVL